MGILRNALGPILAAAMAIFAAHCGSGCKAADNPSAEALYTAKTAECVLKAKDLAESRLCRAKVNWEYGLCPSEELPC